MAVNTLFGKNKLPIDLHGWDPSKIKLGSRIIPFLLFIVTVVAFTVTWLPSGKELLADYFERACISTRDAMRSCRFAR